MTSINEPFRSHFRAVVCYTHSNGTSRYLTGSYTTDLVTARRIMENRLKARVRIGYEVSRGPFAVITSKDWRGHVFYIEDTDTGHTVPMVPFLDKSPLPEREPITAMLPTSGPLALLSHKHVRKVPVDSPSLAVDPVSTDDEGWAATIQPTYISL